MKSFFTLGAIAALCQSAYSLNHGVYTISSAKNDALFLVGQGPDQPLTFGPRTGGAGEYWQLIPAKENFFLIQNLHESFINCHITDSLACFPGGEAKAFRPEFQGDNRYELVEEGSGLFLRITKENTLELAKWDHSIDEQFNLLAVKDESS